MPFTGTTTSHLALHLQGPLPDASLPGLPCPGPDGVRACTCSYLKDIVTHPNTLVVNERKDPSCLSPGGQRKLSRVPQNHQPSAHRTHPPLTPGPRTWASCGREGLGPGRGGALWCGCSLQSGSQRQAGRRPEGQGESQLSALPVLTGMLSDLVTDTPGCLLPLLSEGEEGLPPTPEAQPVLLEPGMWKLRQAQVACPGPGVRPSTTKEKQVAKESLSWVVATWPCQAPAPLRLRGLLGAALLGGFETAGPAERG